MPRKKKTVTTQEVGVPGLKEWNGYVEEELHPRLQGKIAARTFSEMALNDDIVGAALYAIEGFLRRVDWVVVPADESAGAKEQADFLRSCMHDMDAPWSDFISDVLSMLVYGYSLHEIVYKYRRGIDQTNPRWRSKHDDGRVGWRNLSCRAQESIEKWDIDPSTGEILGACQQPPPNYAERYLPMNRCVLFRTKSYKNNPEGVSILRRAYRAWYFKKRIQEIEAIGIARDLNGIPVFEVPAQFMTAAATPAQRALIGQFKNLVSLIARDQLEGLVIPAETDSEGKPTGYKFRLASSSGQKQVPADPVIRRYDSRIAMSLASEFLMLGTEKTGSFALAAEKSSTFVKSLEWYCGVIRDQLNNVCVARLMQANAVPPEQWPSIQYGELDTPDLQRLGLYLSQIAGAGLITPTPELEVQLREMADLTAPNGTEMDAIVKRIETSQKAADLAAKPTPAPVAPENDPADPAETDEKDDKVKEDDSE